MDLGMHLAQKTTLTPQMAQSIKILQMDCAELNEYVKEQMLENPVIELDIRSADDSKLDILKRKLEWLENQNFKEKENVGYYDEEDENLLEKTAGALQSESLVEHLMKQMVLAHIPAALVNAVQYMVGCIDSNGYMTLSKEELAQEAGVSDTQLEDVISIVQAFDPPGVGAFTLSECLCLQLDAQDTLGKTIVEECLELLGKNHIAAISKKLDAPQEDVAQAVRRIRGLNPKPGSLYSKPEIPTYITPDVVVTKFQDKYYVMLCEFSYPEIRLSTSYLSMMKECPDKEVATYITDKISKANWIRQCIENRNKTLLEVAKTIVKKQERFFHYGPQHLNILKMKDVADALGIHESTVSRAVKNKYLQCPYGVYPLKFFFVKGIENPQSVEISTDAVKAQIKALIDTEDDQKPLSDQKIADLLSEQGTQISRRTVAKYRDLLGIAPSSSRINYSGVPDASGRL